MLIKVLYIKTHGKFHILKKETSTPPKPSTELKKCKDFNDNIDMLFMQSSWIYSTIYPEKKITEILKVQRYAGKRFKGKKIIKLGSPLHFAESEMHKHNLCPIALIPSSSFIFSRAFLHLFQSEMKCYCLSICCPRKISPMLHQKTQIIMTNIYTNHTYI